MLLPQGWQTKKKDAACLPFNFDLPTDTQSAILHGLINNLMTSDPAHCTKSCNQCNLHGAELTQVPGSPISAQSTSAQDYATMSQIAQKRALAWNEQSYASALCELLRSLRTVREVTSAASGN